MRIEHKNNSNYINILFNLMNAMRMPVTRTKNKDGN